MNGVVASAGRDAAQRVASERAFFGVAAFLFVASAALTVVWCGAMSGMGEMPRPGGGTMSMMWMRMPGQTWSGAAASFMGMWVVMMVAMMLPALMPMLWRYRQVVGDQIVARTGDSRAGSAWSSGAPAGDGRTGGAHIGWLTALVAVAYFFVWTLLGMAVFPLGAALAALEMQQAQFARAVPAVVGVVVLIVGFLQLTAWKARQLSCCREARGGCRTLSADASTAWRQGLSLGLQCSRCCGGLMVILLVIGVMDLRAMTVVTAAITVERLAPAGERVARAIGAAVVGVGLILIVRAVGIG
jgi:predicted metal-binding membrane protein